MTFPCHPYPGASGSGGGWTPASPGGLLAWYDFSDAGNTTIVSGAYSAVVDKSGNGYNLSQGTSSQRPTQQVSAQNGLNTARFTASNSQKMSLASTLNATNNHTIFAVMRRGGPSGSNISLTLGSTVNTGNDVFDWYSDQHIYMQGTAGYEKSNTESSTAYNAWYGFYNGSSSYFYFNETNPGGAYSSTSQSNNNYNVFGYGGAAYSNGEIGEFGVYSGQLSSPNLATLQTYIKNKWGTP